MSRLGALRPDQDGVRGERRLLEGRADEAPVVQDDAPGKTLGWKLVGKAPGNRDGRLWIVRVVEVGEHAPCLGGSHALLERVQEHRVLGLLPAARAEPRSDERCRRDRVVRSERRCGNALRPVPRVDPGGVGIGDRQDFLPCRPLRAKRVELVRKEGFGLGTRDERAAGECKGERIEPGDVERGHPGRPRMSWSSRPRSAAVTQPAPKATSVSLLPVT